MMRSTSQAGDAAGVPGGLALGVVEVRGHGDDGLGDLLAEELRRVLGQLAEHERGDFLGGVQSPLTLKRTASSGPGTTSKDTAFSSLVTSS